MSILCACVAKYYAAEHEDLNLKIEKEIVHDKQ